MEYSGRFEFSHELPWVSPAPSYVEEVARSSSSVYTLLEQNEEENSAATQQTRGLIPTYGSLSLLLQSWEPPQEYQQGTPEPEAARPAAEEGPTIPIIFGTRTAPIVFVVDEGLLGQKSGFFWNILRFPSNFTRYPYQRRIELFDDHHGWNRYSAELFEVIRDWMYDGPSAIMQACQDPSLQGMIKCDNDNGQPIDMCSQNNICQTILAKIYIEADKLAMPELKHDILRVLAHKLKTHSTGIHALELITTHFSSRTTTTITIDPFNTLLLTRLSGIIRREPALIFEPEPHCSWVSELQRFLANHPEFLSMLTDHAFQHVRRNQGFAFHPGFTLYDDPEDDFRPVACCPLNGLSRRNLCCGGVEDTNSDSDSDSDSNSDSDSDGDMDIDGKRETETEIKRESTVDGEWIKLEDDD